MNEHLNKQFDVELDRIRTRVLRMGGLVESQVLAALDACGHGNLKSMREIVRNDRQVDAFEIGIDEECTLLIARRQPTARDLRLVVAISRLVTDLERIGDKAAKIANKARKLHRAGGTGIPRLAELQHIGQLATDMLHNALDALARLDTATARQIIGADDTLDSGLNAIMRQLITYMMEDPRTIGQALDIVWIAKAIERIGDHVTNIAENIIYIASGEDIRHVTNVIANKERSES
ncbi:MAG TPA: phosphate signaling complex protein PhoU [Accumulibacter sp.]|jgi:phosphate transport system protein|nr:phosphate signaling complex protein PhoU [Accumulibacter sp.]HPP48035.1 phosphate signaling complex protein PhoU [Accumulibacter sp.]